MKSSHITLGYRNLTRRKSRTLLTMTGVILAIGFTVGLLSISEGFMKSFDEMFSSDEPEIFVLPPGDANTPFPMQCLGSGIDQRIAIMIGAVPNVKYAEPAARLMASAGKGKGKGSMMQGVPMIVFGIRPESFMLVHPRAKMLAGRLLRDGDGKTLMLGNKYAQNMGASVGDTLEIEGIKFKVVGVLKEAGEIYDFMGYLPLKTAQAVREQPDKVCQIFVKLKDVSKTDETVKTIKKMYPKNDIQTAQEMIGKAKEMMATAQAVHFGVSCFALIIGVLFVATTMIMSVAERTRELATLRVIGASRWFITKMIMTESLILSVIGGFLGFAFGVLLSNIINMLMSSAFGDSFMHPYISFKLFLIGFGVSVLIGALAGILPARMIMKKQLAESLRYE